MRGVRGQRPPCAHRASLARPGPARLTHLLEDVLLAHQLLPLPVGLGEDHLKDVLPRVGATRDEVNQVFQQLGDRP